MMNKVRRTARGEEMRRGYEEAQAQFGSGLGLDRRGKGRIICVALFT